jgi:hypothetical protein
VDSFSNYLHKNRNELENKFYSQLDHDKKKIFLIGSSHVGRLNQTDIQEYLHNNNVDYKVYNLAFGAEIPWDRLSYVDSIINAKPDLVVYGVGYRDFMDTALQFDSTIPQINLPNPSQDFKYGINSLGNFLHYDFDKFRSPQLVFRYLIRDHFDLNIEQDTSIYEKTKPFYPYDQREIIILNDTQLQKLAESWNFKVNSMPSYDKNQNAYALSQIVEKLKNNNIKVIIFSTPHSKYYTDKLPLKFIKEFDGILQRFSQDGVHVYLLRDKYIDLPIWSDTHHIAVNPKALIYSTDIAKIILNETNP